ncbi:LOW QUALITY PROTEIN: paraneoplastic antigen-like protein 8B [Megaptera novaeangliae]
MSLLGDRCRGLAVDVHRALLVTGVPEDLEQTAIEAVLKPALLPLGKFRLRNTRAMRDEKAKAALMEFVKGINHGAVPKETPGKDGVWRVLCKDSAEGTRVLRQMKRLLLDKRPPQAAVARAPGDTPTPPASETPALGGPGVREAAPPLGAAKDARGGRRGRRNRTRGSRLTRRARRGRGGRPSTWERESQDSSDSLGIVIEEVDKEDLRGDGEQSALYTTLQAAAKELVRKWALQREGDGNGPGEFLALTTVTDKAKKREMEKDPPGAESISLNIKEDRSKIPDLVALLAVRDASDEETMGSDASQSESQENGDQEREGVDIPEFVAIVACTDPADHYTRDEMLKIASVIELLGWSDKEAALPEVLSVMAKDTSGTRVKVEEAGRQVDAVVLRKAKDGGHLLRCTSTVAEPQTPSKGKKAPGGPLAGWGEDEEDEGGLLDLVALLAVQDVAEVTEEEKEKAWQSGRFRCAKGNLGEVLALLAALRNRESEETSEDVESEESEPEDRASRKPRAKRARTAFRAVGWAGWAAAPAPSGTRGTRKTRGGGGGPGGLGIPPETEAQDEAAGSKSRKGRAGAGAAKGGQPRARPPAGSKSTRGKKAGRGKRLPPKCR